MADKKQRQRAVRKIVFVWLIVGIAFGVFHLATERREWAIPPEAKAMKNPVMPSEAALQSARPIYNERCAQCHGDTGKGDGKEARSHGTLPADFTEPGRMAAQSDGELFYKISAGKRPMPAFQNRLTEEQRWQLVLLVRSFAGGIRPP
ncbi:MAG TPA: cytochrome c [Candidatus Dormibacteraeota bacterium]|nr:cytochrome c [Candidatus Dormibacteraeota bacterium]